MHSLHLAVSWNILKQLLDIIQNNFSDDKGTRRCSGTRTPNMDICVHDPIATPREMSCIRKSKKNQFCMTGKENLELRNLQVYPSWQI